MILKINFGRAQRLSAVLTLLVMAGCNSTANRPDADISGNFLGNGFKNAARGIAAGRAFDRAVLAQGRGDNASAMEHYRRAQLFLDSENPVVLNAAGFTLADQGKSREDFQIAEKLTRKSLAIMASRIAKLQEDEGGQLQEAQLREARYFAAVCPRDSLAWALFKQKKYDEALKEQTRALADAKANKAPHLFGDSDDSLPDLLYHFGAIHAALGQKEKAKTAFDEALKINPKHLEAQKARAAL